MVQPETSPRSPLLFGLLAVLLPGSAPLWALGLGVIEHDRNRELPAYTLSLATVSGAPGAPLQLDPAAVLDLTLRPATQVSGQVAVQAALLYDTGIEPWPITLEGSAAGTFRLRAPLQTLPAVRPGLRQLVFLIGRPGELPLWSAGWPPASARLQLLRQPIELLP